MIKLTNIVSESSDALSLSRKRKKGKKGKSKKGSARSEMLRQVMPQFSGDAGERLANAFKALDESAVASGFDTIRDRLVAKIVAKKKQMGVK